MSKYAKLWNVTWFRNEIQELLAWRSPDNQCVTFHLSSFSNCENEVKKKENVWLPAEEEEEEGEEEEEEEEEDNDNEEKRWCVITGWRGGGGGGGGGRLGPSSDFPPHSFSLPLRSAEDKNSLHLLLTQSSCFIKKNSNLLVDVYLTVLRVQSWFLFLVMIGHALGERSQQRENFQQNISGESLFPRCDTLCTVFKGSVVILVMLSLWALLL